MILICTRRCNREGPGLQATGEEADEAECGLKQALGVQLQGNGDEQEADRPFLRNYGNHLPVWEERWATCGCFDF